MKTQVTRRRFLVGAGCLCGGVALASRLGRFAVADEPAAVWPVTCRDVMLRALGQKDSWSALQAVGAEGAELEVAPDHTLTGLFHPTIKYTVATPAGVEQLGADAKAAGQRITAFLTHNRFEERTEAEIKECIALAQAAQTLGVPAIRIDVVPSKLSCADFLKLSVDAIQKIIAATESTGVVFAVENHSTTTNDPAVLKALFAGVGSKRLGLTLDTGNFYWYGHPLSKVYELYETFAPRVFHTHCKSIRYPEDERNKQRPMGWKYAEYEAPIDQGDIDFARVVAILHKAGYHNDLCVEDEFLDKLGPAKATERMARQIQYLKRLRSEVSDK